MTTKISNVCSLEGDDLQARAAQWQDLRARALVSSDRNGEGARLVYRRSQAVEQELEALVIAERQCCGAGGIGWELTVEEQTVTLDVTAPEDVRTSPEAKLIFSVLAGETRAASEASG